MKWCCPPPHRKVTWSGWEPPNQPPPPPLWPEHWRKTLAKSEGKEVAGSSGRMTASMSWRTSQCRVASTLMAAVRMWEFLSCIPAHSSSSSTCTQSHSWQCSAYNTAWNSKTWYGGFPTRMVYLYYISCFRYIILVRNPRYGISVCYNLLKGPTGPKWPEQPRTVCNGEALFMAYAPLAVMGISKYNLHNEPSHTTKWFKPHVSKLKGDTLTARPSRSLTVPVDLKLYVNLHDKLSRNDCIFQSFLHFCLLWDYPFCSFEQGKPFLDHREIQRYKHSNPVPAKFSFEKHWQKYLSCVSENREYAQVTDLFCNCCCSSSVFPSYVSGIHHTGWDFCIYVTIFNPTIEVVTFRLGGWCMLGVFLLPAFNCLGHDCEDLLSPWDGMPVCTD